MRFVGFVFACIFAIPMLAGPAASAGMTDGQPGDRQASCELISAPPARLATVSKYDQAMSSKSVIDEAASSVRRQALAPVENAVRSLESTIAMRGIVELPSGSSDCAARSLQAWAEAGSLTDMATMDANLTRDRFMASIAASLALLKQQGDDLSVQPVIRSWLTGIARQTMAYYDLEAGPISRRNNHRYWAGLAVGQIGAFLGDGSMTEWAAGSLEIGLCQVDEQGFLPLELSRGRKALDYHLFSFVALRSLSNLLADDVRVKESKCAIGLSRLQARVEAALFDGSSFEAQSGSRQDPASKQNVAAAARLIATVDNHGNKGT